MFCRVIKVTQVQMVSGDMMVIQEKMVSMDQRETMATQAFLVHVDHKDVVLLALVTLEIRVKREIKE